MPAFEEVRGLSGPDIFLSYARTDRAVAHLFADCFEQEGFSVWWDASLHSGETFDEVIEQNLRDSKAVVVLWSPNSVTSRWVRAEATQADRRNKLAPAVIEACDRPLIFELTHAAELEGWSGDRSDTHWRTFVKDLHRLVSRSNKPSGSAKNRIDDIRPAAPAHPTSTDNVSIGAGEGGVILSGKSSSEEAVDIHYLQIDGEEAGEKSFPLTATSAKIGRSPPAEIVIPDKSVSREHCLIGIANDVLLVTDLNSTNGTFIDGERITRTTILPVGAELRVGQVALRHSIGPRENGDRNGAAGRTTVPTG